MCKHMFVKHETHELINPKMGKALCSIQTFKEMIAFVKEFFQISQGLNETYV